jgi:hypothetical protein
MVKSKRQKLEHLTAKNIFDEAVPLVPWNFTTDENAPHAFHARAKKRIQFP